MDQAKNLRLMTHQKTSVEQPVSGNKGTSCVKQNGRCRSIAITSGKGGVGKSHTAIALAVSLSRLKKQVLIFDGDFGLANIHIMCGIAPKFNLAQVVQGVCTLSDTLCSGPEGITIIPGSSGITTMANLESLHLETLIRELVRLENMYDFLIIDGGAGIAQASVQLCSMADTALLVITPEPTSLADAYATAKILFNRGARKILVLVNMAESEKDAQEIFTKLHSLVQNFIQKQVQFIGSVPYDKNVSRYIRSQKNICIEKVNSTVALRICNVARQLCNLQPAKESSFFSRLFTPQLRKG